MTGKTTLAASVAARLLSRARQSGDDYQTLLTGDCLERFLYRLGVSDRRDRFVLKGAMLLRLWSDRPYPATVDLEAIRAEDEYAGTRATLPARSGRAHLMLQVDKGLGDVVWPAPEACVYPTLLDLPAPELLAYPREAVVAEKLEAMVVLGDDLHYPASRLEFDRGTLAEAVRRTFERRHTPIPEERPIGLPCEYWENPPRPVQVLAFARRARIAVPDDFADACARTLDAFLSPVLEDLCVGASRAGTWRAGGPWR